MKKVMTTVILIAVLYMITTVPLYASANEGPTFSVGSNVQATRGGTVTVPISVSNNPGFTVAGLVITYDPGVIQVTGVTAPVSEMPLNTQFALTTSQGTQWIPLLNSSLTDWNGSGTVVNITFSVSSTAALDTSNITIAFIGSPDGTPANADGDVLRGSTVVSGSVNVVDNGSSIINTPPPEDNDAETGDDTSGGGGTGTGAGSGGSTGNSGTGGSSTGGSGTGTGGGTSGSGTSGTGSSGAVATGSSGAGVVVRSPQTSVPDITWAVVTMFISFTSAIVLIIFFLLYIKPKR